MTTSNSAGSLDSAATADFPIVGIGRSAGGLDALERFLSHIPDSGGMVFVIDQRFAQTHVSALPKLLARAAPR